MSEGREKALEAWWTSRVGWGYAGGQDGFRAGWDAAFEFAAAYMEKQAASVEGFSKDAAIRMRNRSAWMRDVR